MIKKDRINVKPFTIKTKRLTIRLITERDYQNYCDSMKIRLPPQNKFDKGNTRKLLNLTEYKKQTHLMRKKWDENEYFCFGVFRGKDRVGGIALDSIVRVNSHSAQIGWAIFNNYWGQGFGKEAIKAFLPIAIKKFKLHRIEAIIQLGNSRSMNLARGAGMRYEGTARNRYILDKGKWEDVHIFALTCEDLGIRWEDIQPKEKKKSKK